MLTAPCLCCLQAELMYRRNKEEVEGLQAKRKQVRRSTGAMSPGDTNPCWAMPADGNACANCL